MVRVFDKKTLNDLCMEASTSPRKRKNLNLHPTLEDPVQKLFIAMQKDSYVRPHRHPQKEKTELFLSVQGKLAALIFNNDGTIAERIEFSANGDAVGAEIKPDTWHTIIALEDSAVFFEVKQGPYTMLSDKDFASWAPEENTSEVENYIHWLHQAKPGDRLSTL